MSGQNQNEPNQIGKPEAHENAAGSGLNLSAFAVKEKAITLFLLIVQRDAIIVFKVIKDASEFMKYYPFQLT